MEVIIVEGRDDVAAIKAAVDADIIATHGYGISEKTFAMIENAYLARGIIIFTDPDHAGNMIRKRLTEKYPEAKQAYLTRADAIKDGDIGIENAKPADIIKALDKAGSRTVYIKQEYSETDMAEFGFSGKLGSATLREKVGQALGIGYGNSKAFLNKLNNYGISREEIIEIIKGI